MGGGTFQGVSGEAELADDVLGDVRLHALAHLGVALGRLQAVVELLRVKLLQGGPAHACWHLAECTAVYGSTGAVHCLKQRTTYGRMNQHPAHKSLIGRKMNPKKKQFF